MEAYTEAIKQVGGALNQFLEGSTKEYLGFVDYLNNRNQEDTKKHLIDAWKEVETRRMNLEHGYDPFGLPKKDNARISALEEGLFNLKKRLTNPISGHSYRECSNHSDCYAYKNPPVVDMVGVIRESTKCDFERIKAEARETLAKLIANYGSDEIQRVDTEFCKGVRLPKSGKPQNTIDPSNSAEYAPCLKPWCENPPKAVKTDYII